jgi:hypothetical protein
VELKLPTLYLIDSICKNIGEPYIGVFSTLLSTAVPATFRQLRDERTRTDFGRTMETWWDMFPEELVREMHERTFGDPSSLGRRRPSETVLHEPPAHRNPRPRHPEMPLGMASGMSSGMSSGMAFHNPPPHGNPRPNLPYIPPQLPPGVIRLLEDLRTAMAVPPERYNEKRVAEIMYHVSCLF